MRHPLAAAVAVAMAATGPAGLGARAGEEPRSVRESVDVTIVEVPVRVLDRSGEPVRGLTAADFTLLDQGRPQTLAAADAIELGETAGAAPRRSVPSAARRRYLLLFDFAFARPNAVVAARRAAREFVLDGMLDTDLAAIGTYSAQAGVRLLVTFSSDRAALAEAIETLGLEPSERTDPLQFAYRSRRPPGGAVRTESGGRHAEGSARRRAQLADIVRTMANVDRARTDEYERSRVKSLLQSLQDLGRVLDVVEGRKDIVLLSEGFPSRLLVGAPETREEQQWLVQGEMWKVDSERRYGSVALRSDLSEMGDFLKRTQCVIHTVDIAGFADEAERASPGEAGASWVPRANENALFHLSSETGGETFRGRTDIDGELRRLARRTSLVYVLAYRPDRREGEGRYHALKVKVGRPGVKVISRPGYFERRDFRQRTPFERSLSAADIIANETPHSEIRPRVLAAPFTGSVPGGEAQISLAIEIPGDELLRDEEGDRTTLEIYAYAFDGSQRVADFLVEPLGLDVVKATPRLSTGGIRYFGELRLPPGDYRLRTLVRNANTGRAGLVAVSLRVPPFGEVEPRLLDPIFLEPGSASWFAVRGSAREGEGVAPVPALASIASLGGENVVPSAEPRISPGSTAKICLVSYHFGQPAKNAEGFRIGSELLGADGGTLSPAAITLLGQTPPEADGRRTFLLAFTAPRDIAPGRYALRVFLEDPSTSKRREASAAFVVP